MRLTQIEFNNYKAMQEFTADLGEVNLLVGKNNSGKSTILSALRILEYAMRIAQVRTPTRVEDATGKLTIGHHIPEANLPTTIENVHTDYTDVSTLITFTLENYSNLKWTHQSRQSAGEFKLRPFPPQQLPGAAP